MMETKSKKGMAHIAILGIVALIIAAGIGIFITQKAGAPETEGENIGSPVQAQKENETASTAPGYSGAVLAGTSAFLLDFNKTDYEKALASGKLVMLYFYANWCPICKAEFPKMQAAFNGLATDKVIGFRVNYSDNQTDVDEVALARQFGVTYQHTKVFVKNGAKLDRFLDGWDEGRYASEINKRL